MFSSLTFLLATLGGMASNAVVTASPAAAPHPYLNKAAGTWNLIIANLTSRETGETTDLFGPDPRGILIFDRSLFFAELITYDPSTLPRYPDFFDRTLGTVEQKDDVINRTIGQIGRYNVDEEGNFVSEQFIASTFTNWINLYRNTTTFNLTVYEGEDGRTYAQEVLTDYEAPRTVNILWEKIPEATSGYQEVLSMDHVGFFTMG